MGLRGKDLTVSQKEFIVTLNYDGKNNSEIARLLGISRFTVCKFLKRLQTSESKENITENRRKGKCGRKRKSSERTDRMLMNVIKNNKRRSLSEITSTFNESTPQKLSRRTVQRRLHEHGYHRRVVLKTTTISARNRVKRRAFCRSHLHWTVDRDWSKIIFSDETQVVIGRDKRTHVWRTNEEKWKP
jgi:transposase